MMARIRSFFMDTDGNRSDHIPHPKIFGVRAGNRRDPNAPVPTAQTVRRSRAPVSDDG